MKPILHGFCIRCTLFFFCNFHFGFFFSFESGGWKIIFIYFITQKNIAVMYMLLTLVYSTYGIATKNLIFVFRTSLAQNAKYFRRKGIGLLLPGSSHLQRGRFNPQSQLFGQMKIFLSLYNFFFKKFQTWILSQMTPVSTFFERPDLSGRTLQPSKSTFWWKLQFSLEMAFFLLFSIPQHLPPKMLQTPKLTVWSNEAFSLNM